MATVSLEFLITRMLSASEVAQLVAEAIPGYQAVDIFSSEEWSSQTITYSVHESEDLERWVCLLSLYNFPENSKYDDFVEIALAEQLYEKFSVNVIIATNDIVSGLDPYDPYWCLALVDGVWYFASSAESRFMVGDEDVSLPPIQQQPRLISPLNLNKPRRDLFAYRDLVRE